MCIKVCLKMFRGGGTGVGIIAKLLCKKQFPLQSPTKMPNGMSYGLFVMLMVLNPITDLPLFIFFLILFYH